MQRDAVMVLAYGIESTRDFDRQKTHFWIAHAKIEKTCLLKRGKMELVEEERC
jgi:hypothetical protein